MTTTSPTSGIVSLIASATEIVCALGLEDRLVGRSHECDYPESVRALRVCTEPKFPTDGTSYRIDQRVKAILQEGLSVYRVHADVLRDLQPEVIITQSSAFGLLESFLQSRYQLLNHSSLRPGSL